ncbi:MAG: hypothetical protein LLG06_19155 [Desulfobacteraceae bacterium]|nr:hypothetical protein [Desulfobacteraceae bacterium]
MVMAYPPLVYYSTEAEYRSHFERVYCAGSIATFDGITVRFQKDCFDHCFFESTRRNQVKDAFSRQRAERVDWIKATLQDPNADLYIGWDRKKKRYDKSHRVAIVIGNYVVVIRMSGSRAAQFVTAYVADSASTLAKIKKSPRWTPP